MTSEKQSHKEALLQTEEGAAISTLPKIDEDLYGTWKKNWSVISSVLLAVIVAPYFAESLYVINLAVWTNNDEFCPSDYAPINNPDTIDPYAPKSDERSPVT